MSNEANQDITLDDEIKSKFFILQWWDNILAWFNSIGQWFKDFKVANAKQRRRSIAKFFINYALVLFIIVYVIVVAFINPRFLYLNSLVNILSQASLLLMVSLGMAGIIVLTGADLSASSVVYFCVAVLSTLIPNISSVSSSGDNGVYLIKGMLLPLFVVFIVALILGGLVGSINGTLTAKFKVHPFIGTMATNFVFGGSALTMMYLGMLGGQGSGVLLSGGSPIVKLVNNGFSIGKVLVPNIIWFALIAVVILTIIWNKTKFGKNMFAVGCNPEAARVAGVNVTLVTIMVFALAGIMYGYAAFFGLGQNWGGKENSYSLLGLYAIASCVIGGVSFTGGVGKIRGVVFGVILFQLITNSTSYVGLSASIGNVFIGVVVAFAVVFDMLKYRTRT